MMDSVLITGGLGYVGGRVAQALADNPQLFLRLGTRQADLPVPTWFANGEAVSLDIMRDEDLDAACRGVRSVIHLAAMNEIDSTADPQQALIINSLGTLKVLRAAERAGAERFIYFSTAHVYGAPLVGTITEQTLPRPIHPYAITHHVAEDFVLAANDQGTLTGIVLRLSNGFGAPINAGVNRWTLIVNDLCRQAVTTKKLALRSSGLQQRDFITLADVGRAVAHFLDLPAEQCDNRLFNLGGDASLRIIDITERIADRCESILGFRPAIERPDPNPGETSEPLDYRIDKLKATGFSLIGNFDEEIDATLRLCQQAFGGVK